MRFLALALAILMIAATASAQTPAPVGSYVNSGSGWTPLLGTATQGALAFNPTPAALYVFNSSLGKWVPWPGTSGGGGSGTVTNFTAGNLPTLFTTSVATPTTTPALTFTLSSQAANSFFGNFTNAAAAPTFSTNPTFPTGQFANSARVSAIVPGLIEELHFQEANGTTPIDFSPGSANPPTVVGNINLAGDLAGGFNVAAGTGAVTPSGYVLLNPGLNTALTMQTFTCTNAQTLPTAGYFDTLIAGLVSATAPSGATTQALGVFLNGGMASTPQQATLGKYGLSPNTTNNANIITQSTASADGCHVITWRRGTGTNSSDEYFIDSQPAPIYQYAISGSAALVPIGSFALGTPPYATLSSTYKHPWPIYFHNAYNRALTLDEIQTNVGSIQNSMQARGVIKTPVPAYSDSGGNQLLAVGDSITYGLNAGNVGWPALLGGATPAPLNTYLSTNISTPGWQLANLLTECQTRGQGSFNPNANTTVTIFAGTNDLAQVSAPLGTVTPIVAYQRLRRVVQCYKAMNPAPRVLVITMISRGVAGGVSPANDGLKNQYNNLIRQDFAGADGMIDLASFAGLGADGASAGGGTACSGGAACFSATGDHVHPTAAGQQTIANVVASYVNWFDAQRDGTSPQLKTSAYAEVPQDVAVGGNPTGGSFAITLPSAVGLVGTERYVGNIQATGTNTLTVQAISGENIDLGTSILCPNNTKCVFRSVLGATAGTAVADANSGAHWEQFVGQAGGGASGNATSIQSVPVIATAPTSGQVLQYNGTNWGPATVAGATVPTGTGFYHITAGVADGASRAVNLASADVTGTLPTTNLPVGSNSVAGILQCDGTTTTCAGGQITANVAGGGAGLAANTFTGIQIMPVLQDTPVNDTGLVNAAVVANTAVTALSSGEIITFNPVAANTTTTPTLNVNNLGARTITKLGGVVLSAGDLATGTTAVVLYNSAASGTWQLLNPATTVPIATNTTLGQVQGDGTSTTVNGSGVISVIGSSASFASPPAIGNTTPNTGAFTTLTTTGNFTGQGTVNSTNNTSPASTVNTGVALVGQPNVADVVYYDSARTANNRIAEALWFQGSYQLRFKSDDQSLATTFFNAAGGQGTGITGITSSSGTGAWAHTGPFSTTGTITSPSSIIAAAGGPNTPQNQGVSNVQLFTNTTGNQSNAVFNDPTRTANNRIAMLQYSGGTVGLGFTNDAWNAGIFGISIAGGQASGITGITSSSGTGSWVHTGPLSASGILGGGTVNAGAGGYTKGGSGVHTINSCQAAVVPVPVAGTNIYTCNIVGGSIGSICWAVPTNATAQLLWGGTGGASPLSGNVPRATILSGTTLSIIFDTRANVQPVGGGETFTGACTL